MTGHSQSKIGKLAIAYNTYFPTDWIEDQDWSQDKEKESFAFCNSNLNSFQKEFFIEVSKSILSGEYLIKDMQNDIENLTQPKEYQPIDSESILKQETYRRYRCLDNELTKVLIHYRAFILLMNTKTDGENHKYIVNAYFVDEEESSSIELFEYLIVFILRLCKIDHSLSYDERTIRNLILMRVDLEKLIEKNVDEIADIFRIALNKSSFLLKKLIYFKGKSEYVLNFKSYTIDDNSIDIKELQSLNDDFLFLHGEDEKGAMRCDRIFSLQDACNKRKAKSFEMILLMNKYKNHGSETQIDNLIENFERYSRSYSHQKEFNIFAINTIKNYLYNCRFSYLLKHKEFTYYQLIEKYTEIDNIQKLTGVQNFFPHYKVVDKLFSIIRHDIKQKKTDSELIVKEVASLEELIHRLEEKLSWSEENSFYPFQLPYRECRYRINNVILFMPSSFNKPINYQAIRKKVIQYKADFQLLKKEIEFFKEKKDIEVLKEEISSLKRKNIEIVGAFTAAITFLFGCVNIFSENKDSNIKVLVTNLIGLGLLLILFCCIIFILSIPQNEKLGSFCRNPRNILFTVLIIGSLIILYNIIT